MINIYHSRKQRVAAGLGYYNHDHSKVEKLLRLTIVGIHITHINLCIHAVHFSTEAIYQAIYKAIIALHCVCSKAVKTTAHYVNSCYCNNKIQRSGYCTTVHVQNKFCQKSPKTLSLQAVHALPGFGEIFPLHDASVVVFEC